MPCSWIVSINQDTAGFVLPEWQVPRSAPASPLVLGWEAWPKPWRPWACRAPEMLALCLSLDPDVWSKPTKQGSELTDGCAGGCFHACLHSAVISNKKHEFLLHISMAGSAFFHVASRGTSHKTKARVVGHGCCQIKSQQCFALLYNLS